MAPYIQREPRVRPPVWPIFLFLQPCPTYTIEVTEELRYAAETPEERVLASAPVIPSS